MISGKKFNVILAILLAAALIFTFCFTYLPAFTGLQAAAAHPDYEEKLFGSDLISIDILADETEWQNMLDNATAEEYISCDVIVNGTRFTSVGIRPKGNTSLTSVASSDSDRYSFKLEFDHYISGQTCFGLDKFVVNNIQSDATYMKEYLSYQLMEFMDVPSSLCSFASLSVNGEAFGLYLAIEALEESYAARNFGDSYGQLYKPDSQNNQAGGREGAGEGPDANGGREDTQSGADLPGFGNKPFGSNGQTDAPAQNDGSFVRDGGRMQPPGGMNGNPFGGSDRTDGTAEGNMPTPPDWSGNSQGSGQDESQNGTQDAAGNGMPVIPGNTPSGEAQGGFGGGMPGMSGAGGGSDLVYTDDDPESYSDIFDSAVFDADEADYQRVVTALQKLSEGEDLETYIDVDEVLRYFAVNTVLVNLDSYVGNLKHNYYLYEENGRLSILPWDFNLAFAGFQGGSATAAVNFPIDTPVSDTTLEERPLLGKLLEVEAYKALYHQYLQEIVTGYFDSGLFASTVQTLDGLIGGLVESDPTAFYTYEEYKTALETLLTFGNLRAESIQGQLDGVIPSTSDGQSADSTALIDAASINLSDMGTQGGGGMGGDENRGFGGRSGFGQNGADGRSGGWSDDQSDELTLPPTNGADGQDDGGSLPALPGNDAAGNAQNRSTQGNDRQSGGRTDQAQGGVLDGSQAANNPPGQLQAGNGSPASAETPAYQPGVLVTLAASLILLAAGIGFILLYPRLGRRNIY